MEARNEKNNSIKTPYAERAFFSVGLVTLQVGRLFCIKITQPILIQKPRALPMVTTRYNSISPGCSGAKNDRLGIKSCLCIIVNHDEYH